MSLTPVQQMGKIFNQKLFIIFWTPLGRSQIHERAMSVRFLSIILRDLRIEVSEYIVDITKQFQTIFAGGEGGGRGGGNP